MEKDNKVENNTLYTRCPTCTTAFKVTEKLLSAAGGKVRCGACLAIFQATDYMLKPSERNKSSEPAATAVQPSHTHTDGANTIQTNQNTSTSSHSTSPAVDTKPEFQSSEPPSRPQNDEPESEYQEPKTTSESNNEEEIESDSQRLSQNSTVIDTPYESKPEFETNSSSAHSSEFETETHFDADSTFQSETVQDPLVSSDLATDPEIDIDVVTDVQQGELSTSEYQNISTSDSEITTEGSEITAELDDLTIQQDELTESEELYRQRSEPSIGEADEIEPPTEVLTTDSQKIHGRTNDITVDDIAEQLAEQMLDTDAEPDPLDEFEDIVEEKNTDLRRNIIIAAVAILVFIGFQQIWSNRQALAWSESWGGTIQSVCQYLPCDLKTRRDVSKIKLLQRQLSPDEENENQLDVKVLLTNEARFKQPYPTIKIAFSNKNGEQVSVKSFPPSYYLEPDSSDKLMPYGTEVHIHFKTELSHPDALGFEFIFE